MNVLAIGCHPDDLEIGCGGTLAKYAKNGHKVFMCHVTTGNLGHVVIMPDELAVIRENEARAAAAVIGAESIGIGVSDLEVDAANFEVTKKVAEVIRYAKPDVIITHNPDDYMRDHVQTSKIAYNASFTSSIPHMVTKSNSYDKIVPVYYMDTLAGVGFLPTEYVDVTDTIETKLDALSRHESQVKWMKEHDNIDFLDFVRTCSKFRGLQCGAAYAEGFRQYAGWPRMTTKRLLP